MKISKNKYFCFAFFMACLLIAPINSYGAVFKTKKSEVKAEQKKRTTAYERLFKDKKVKTVDGFIKLHLVEQKLYLEIPKQNLDRYFMFSSTLQGTSDPFVGQNGSMVVAPFTVTFEKKDSLLLMREILSQIVTNDPNISKALDLNNINPIYKQFPIKAYGKDSSIVIDATALFNSDEKKLSAFNDRNYARYGMFNAVFNAGKSSIKDVKAGSDYMSVISEATYDVNLSFQDWYGNTVKYFEKEPITTVASRSITMLAKNQEVLPRLADPRIGVNYIPAVKFDINERGAKNIYYTTKRKIFDDNGEIIPIVYYIDTAFNKVYFEAIKDGIELWNKAFEKMGYQNVIQAKPFPSDDNFDSGSITNSYVRMGSYAYPGISTRTLNDPRTGQILGSNMVIPIGYEEELNKDKFMDLGGQDKKSRALISDDETLYKLIKAKIAYLAGTTLGLVPNNGGTYAYSLQDLRSPSFTQENGLSSTIMAPLGTYNYAAQPEDVANGVVLINDILGPYDYYAIDWLYGRIPGVSTPEAETRILDKKISEKSDDPRYQYLNARSPLDSRVRMKMNAGTDVLEGFDLRLENIKRLMANLTEAFDDYDYDYMLRQYIYANYYIPWEPIYILNEYLRYVTGAFYNPKYEGDNKEAFANLPASEKRKGFQKLLNFIDDYSWMEADKQFMYDSRETQLGRSTGWTSADGPFFVVVNMSLYPSHIVEGFGPEDALDMMYNHFTKELVNNSPVSDIRKEHLKCWVLRLLDYSKIPNYTVDQSQVVAYSPWVSSPSMNMGDEIIDNNALNEISSDKYFGQYPGGEYKVNLNLDHLYFAYLKKSNEVLKKGATNHPDQDTRDVCRHLSFVIERALNNI